MTYNVRNIVIALVLAAVAALPGDCLHRQRPEAGQEPQDTVGVLVATTDIPAGTPAAGGDLERHSSRLRTGRPARPDRARPTEASAARRHARVAAQPHLRGPADHGRDVRAVQPDQHRPAGSTRHYRAIEIQLGDDAILLGTLQAGDHVDLVGTYTVHPNNGGSDFDVSRIIVRDVEVLQGARGNRGHQGRARPAPNGSGDSVILKVPDTVVPKITFTLHGGDFALWFALRPGANGRHRTARPPSPPSSRSIFDGLTATQIVKAISVPAPKGN